jgi:hypothetical protein
MSNMIQLFDANMKLLAETPQKQYKRYSMTAAANQKILDSLIAKRPTGTEGHIDGLKFKVIKGKSYWIGFLKD